MVLDFYGANSLEGARIDVVLETMGDIEHKMMPLFADQDAAKKVQLYILRPRTVYLMVRGSSLATALLSFGNTLINIWRSPPM